MTIIQTAFAFVASTALLGCVREEANTVTRVMKETAPWLSCRKEPTRTVEGLTVEAALCTGKQGDKLTVVLCYAGGVSPVTCVPGYQSPPDPAQSSPESE